MTKEERGQRLLKMSRLSGSAWWWPAVAIEEQDRREGPLVEALLKLAQNWPYSGVARDALAAYDALDAKPEPTLLECAKRVGTARQHEYAGLGLVAALDALKAAVEREERRK